MRRAACGAESTSSRALHLEVGWCLGVRDEVREREEERKWVQSLLRGAHCSHLSSSTHCATAGRDGAVAFDFLSQALDLAEASLAGSDGHAAAALPPLAPPSAETSVEGDVPPLLTAGEVRFSALTWLGRCVRYCVGGRRKWRGALSAAMTLLSLNPSPLLAAGATWRAREWSAALRRLQTALHGRATLLSCRSWRRCSGCMPMLRFRVLDPAVYLLSTSLCQYRSSLRIRESAV